MVPHAHSCCLSSSAPVRLLNSIILVLSIIERTVTFHPDSGLTRIRMDLRLILNPAAESSQSTTITTNDTAESSQATTTTKSDHDTDGTISEASASFDDGGYKTPTKQLEASSSTVPSTEPCFSKAVPQDTLSHPLSSRQAKAQYTLDGQVSLQHAYLFSSHQSEGVPTTIALTNLPHRPTRQTSTASAFSINFSTTLSSLSKLPRISTSKT